jgi:tRNA(fMet)-specific endonuclease VapC
MRYMLDTDICVYASRKNRPQVIARVGKHSPGDLVISTVTYGELRFGAEKSAQPNAALRVLNEFIEAVPVVPLENQTAEHYGRIRHLLERQGRAIGANDLWIAAHCLQLGLTLVTNNEREFSRIPNLAIENWTH